MVMRRLCRKLDREDGLETVLEVPIPEEMFADDVNAGGEMRTWLNAQAFDNAAADDQHQQQQVSRRKSELQLLLNVVGLPLVPCPVPSDHAFGGRSILLRDNSSLQESSAKYIIHQYIAATGGQAALTSISTMYAVGKVRMSASEFQGSDGPNEVGGYVLWQRSPDVWYFELIMAGCKMSAGSDGKLTWRQSASMQSHALRGPPRPLRRSLQGLDPRSTANLFSNDAVCTGEKTINGEECFMLKLEADRETLKARSAANFDMVHHTIWGYFSQRTGLLVQLDDTYLLSMKGAGGCGQTIFWETTMESALDDYRLVDGVSVSVSVAHAGHTTVTLSRYGEGTAKHKRRMEETWTIEEVDFNLLGLSMDCFLPPADMKKDQDGWQQ